VGNETRTAVLLDQHPLWLNALERILVHAGVDPVATATTTTAALASLEEHRPDLFLLDLDINGSKPDGLTCLRNALAAQPSLKAVVVSASDDSERIETALGSGAVAYVLKRAEPEDLASAIRQVFSRSLYLAGAEAFAQMPRLEEVEAAGLTRREREILQLVSEGNTNGQVAKVLWVTEQTVKFHLANIFRKLDVRNRTQASRWAHAHGLVRLNAREENQPADAGALAVGGTAA
jgi:DNA-binding NarL/FixJ family response regulator